MARQKNNKKTQDRKQQNKRRENKVRLAGLGDTLNLVGAWVAFYHPTFTVSVAFIIWVIACWERNRSNG
jgi:type II secretory pathway component PulM